MRERISCGGGQVCGPHSDSIEIVFDWLGRQFDASLDALALAEKERRTLLDRLLLLLCFEGKLLDEWRGGKVFNVHSRKNDLALGGFLPALEKLAIDLDRFDPTQLVLQIRHTDSPGNRVQKPDLHVELAGVHQALGLLLRCFAAIRGIDHAEVPAPAVFHRRRPVGIQHVAFIENCVRNAIHQSHARTASGRSCSSTSSQVANPRSILN